MEHPISKTVVFSSACSFKHILQSPNISKMLQELGQFNPDYQFVSESFSIANTPSFWRDAMTSPTTHIKKIRITQAWMEK